MPVVRFHVEDLERLLGKPVPRAELVETIPQLGADVDDVSGPEWAIEFFPDRPDLFSVEGVARALRAYFGIQPGLSSYPVDAPRHALRVDPTVRDVRPFIAGCFVRNVPMSERRLDALIALQEDLHWGLGARRRRVAIGVHDAAALVPPFTYRAARDGEARFVPLGETREMGLREILEKHPKGRDFAHLVAGADRYPLITDAKGQVLSFPPIINGTLTTVTPRSRDLFLDVTGTDAWAVGRALNLLATGFAEAGARLEAVRLEGAAEGVTPDLAPDRRDLEVAAANRLLGTTFGDREVAEKLRRMGYGAEPRRPGVVAVEVPAYRPDILHDVDLVEDVGIGHGFTKFEPAPLRSVTTGRPLVASRDAERARQALVGLGYLEVLSLSLSSDEEQFRKMGEEAGRAVRVKNPATTEHTLLRAKILPSLLHVLARNTHRELPQRLFEVGVVTLLGADAEPRPVRRVAGVEISPRAGFSDAKGVALALARDLRWDAAVEPASAAWLVPGRAAKLGGRGLFGEVHPATLAAFGLGYPAVAFEFDL